MDHSALTGQADNTLAQLARTHWNASYRYSKAEYERFARKYAFNYRNLLPADRNARILDIGCAGGYFLFFLRSENFRNITGVDSNPAAIEFCRQNVIETARVADAHDYLLANGGSFDVIVCNHLIEHFPFARSLDLCRRMHSALAPGGRVIVTVPNAMTPWSGYHLFHDATHDHLYTPETLTETLEISGFSEVKVLPEGPVPYDALTLVRYVLWKLREAWLKAAFAIDVGIGRTVRTPKIMTQGLIGVGTRSVGS